MTCYCTECLIRVSVRNNIKVKPNVLKRSNDHELLGSSRNTKSKSLNIKYTSFILIFEIKSHQTST